MVKGMGEDSKVEIKESEGVKVLNALIDAMARVEEKPELFWKLVFETVKKGEEISEALVEIVKPEYKKVIVYLFRAYMRMVKAIAIKAKG